MQDIKKRRVMPKKKGFDDEIFQETEFYIRDGKSFSTTDIALQLYYYNHHVSIAR